MIKVLFVCMGNICRSPTADGVFKHIVEQAGLGDQIYIDSAGTHSYHIGSQPDSRSQAAALKRGIDLSSLRARQVNREDFVEFDYVLAMDRDNYRDLQSLCLPEQAKKLHLFLEFAPKLETREVPDPYFGRGQDGFEHVLNLIEAASQGLLTDIRQRLSS